jgi:predicted acylesterase/phospholipase RssA
VIKGVIKEKLTDESQDTATMAEFPRSGDDICPTFVVAMSAASGDSPAVLFRSYGCTGHNASKCPIWQAARATTAAPSFFKEMFVDIPVPGAWYIDGGLRHNNPSKLALEEAHRIWPKVKRVCLVSIGTGRQRNAEFMKIEDSHVSSSKAVESKGRFRSMLGRIPVIRTMKNAPSGAMGLKNIAEACVAMSTSSEPIHHELYKSANSSDPDQRFPYHRFNVEKGMESIGFEEWKANVRMGELTTQYMREAEGERNRNNCVQDLIKPAAVERK